MNLHTWWESLSMVEKRVASNKAVLVHTTEANNDGEISAFVKTTSNGGIDPSETEEDADAENAETTKEV